MTSITLKRLFVAVVSLVAVSAAFALGYSSTLATIQDAPHVLQSASSWLVRFLNGETSTAWNVAAALGVMAVIAKRSGKREG